MINAALVRAASAVAAGAITFGAGAACAAGPQAQVPTVAVSYRAADLATSAGAQRLYHRIEVAALKVCAGTDTHNVVQTQAQRQCYLSALANAVSSVDRPELTALHRERTQRTPA